MARKETAGVKNKTGLQKNIIAMNQSLVALQKELENLRNNVDALMVGNSEGPYWNGNKAMKFYRKAIKNLENNIKDYKTAYTQFNKLANKYEDAMKKDK